MRICIVCTLGEDHLSIRALVVERGIPPRSLPPPEHKTRTCLTCLAASLRVGSSFGPWLWHMLWQWSSMRYFCWSAEGSRSVLPWALAVIPGSPAYLRVALRMRVSGSCARFGRRSERCRVLDGGVCVCRSCPHARMRVDFPHLSG